MPPAQPLTKTDLKAALRDQGRELREHWRDDLRDAVQTLSAQMNNRFSKVDQQLVEANTKLEAIMSGEVLVTRDQLLKLVHQLKARGIKLDERKIFTPIG